MVVDGDIVAHLGAGFNDDDRGEHYVYTHSIEGYGVFYVGKGKDTRYTETCGRSRKWKEFARDLPIIKKKVVDGISEELAVMIEFELISKFIESGHKLANILVSRPDNILSAESKAKMSANNLGMNNPYADKNIYHFVHKSGDEFVGTRIDFADKYGFSPYVLFKPKSKHSYKTHNGWTLKGREFYRQDGEHSRVSDKKRYLFKNDDGTVFEGLRTAFSKKFGIQSKRLFGKRAMRVYFGWRVISCLDDPEWVNPHIKE